MFRAFDKKTGKVIHEMQLPACDHGIPMTYMVDGRQFIVTAVGRRAFRRNWWRWHCREESGGA